MTKTHTQYVSCCVPAWISRNSVRFKRIGACLQGSIPFWSYKLVARIHDALHAIAIEENSETLSKCAFWYRHRSCFDFYFFSSIIAKRFPFIGIAGFGKTKKSTGAKTGEYGGWSVINVLFLAKNSRTSIECELVSYLGAKSMIGSSTILCISDENFRVIGA